MADQIVKELIKELEELNQTGAIGFSTYKSLLSKVRQLQVS